MLPTVPALFVFVSFFCVYGCQLVINVKNQGGDIVQESITSNTTEETISLEFQRPEGTLITQFVDFKSELQVLRVLVLGEEERGQSQYQVLCFVTRLSRGDFISPDAMAKLRQRNPGAVRQPEEERPREHLDMDLSVDLPQSRVLSPHLLPLCQEAEGHTYAREVDLRAWAAARGDVSALTASVRRQPLPRPLRCSEAASAAPCRCRLEVCVGWYPCGLKFCRGRDAGGKSVSYRCGIKTCRRCRSFEFSVAHKQACLWDE